MVADLALSVLRNGPPGTNAAADADTALPPWDSSAARALLEWTAANIKPELWPVAFGLGYELNGYLTPEAWAQNVVTLL